MSTSHHSPQEPKAGTATAPGVVSSGWLAAQSTFEHTGDTKFGVGAIGSIVLHALAFVLILFAYTYEPEREPYEPPPIETKLIVHLQAPGPGGGGGGSPEPAPPAPMEIPKPVAPDPIPVAPPPEPQVVEEPPKPAPVLNAPVMTTNATNLSASGVSSVSLATYGGGGRGGGVGSGVGNGVGPGEGGGFGGGAFRPGAGIVNPTLVHMEDPKYTSEAMRAKIQGEVTLDVVVLEDGSVGDIKIVKSLDRTFGLDEEAKKAAKLWRFRAGTRNGEKVPVIVTLILEFRLH